MNQDQREEPNRRSVIRMKIMFISLLMMGSLMAFSLSLDIYQGFDLSEALYNAVSPFRVMEIAELVVLFFLLFLFLAESAYVFIKKKKEDK
jgi:cell division protein FtsB